MKKTSLMPRWWKKRFTAVITESDPSCKVVYLGNVLTGWAKGNLLAKLHIFHFVLGIQRCCLVHLPQGFRVLNGVEEIIPPKKTYTSLTRFNSEECFWNFFYGELVRILHLLSLYCCNSPRWIKMATIQIWFFLRAKKNNLVGYNAIQSTWMDWLIPATVVTCDVRTRREIFSFPRCLPDRE